MSAARQRCRLTDFFSPPSKEMRQGSGRMELCLQPFMLRFRRHFREKKHLFEELYITTTFARIC